jgi:hypothetical protein
MSCFIRWSAAASLLFTWAVPAAAQITTNWTNTTGSGNMVHIGTNWDNGVPTAIDTANFNQDAAYNANFSFSTLESNNLNVTAGNVEFFSGLANQTYAVGTDVLIDNASLTLDNVDLDVGDDITTQNGGTLTIDADAALVVGDGATLAGTVNNDGDIEISSGGGIFVPDVAPVGLSDLTLDGAGRVFAADGSAAIRQVPFVGISHLLRQANGHTIEAINGATLTIDSNVSVEQLDGSTIHAGDGSSVVLNGIISGGNVTTSGTGQITFRSTLNNVIVNLPSPGTFVVPLSAFSIVLTGGTTLIVDSEDQIEIDPSVIITTRSYSIQINGDHTLVNSGSGALRRIFGDVPTFDQDQSFIVAGTTTIAPSARIRVEGGAFSTGAVVFGNIDSEIILSSGTFNLTNSDLELGTGMPFRGELQAGTTDINVTNGDVHTLADGVLNTNGNLTAQGLDNAGQVGTIGGSMTFSSAATNQATGQINAINAELNFNGGLTNEGQLNVINTTINGAVNNGGGASVQVAGTATFNGDVSGGADFDGGGTTTFNAHYAPGDNPDSIHFAGSVSFGSGATLEIEIGGLGAGTDFDQLVVTGDVMLDGSLDVTLIAPFSLAPGQSFEIVDVAGTLSSTFSGLPQGAAVGNFGGTDLRISYFAGDGNDVALLTVSGLAGDYNNNGVVDAADYTVWRDNLGAAAGTLLNDTDGGEIDGDQYDTWVSNFGTSVAASAVSSAAVPEPGGVFLALLAAAGGGAACLRSGRG